MRSFGFSFRNKMFNFESIELTSIRLALHSSSEIATTLINIYILLKVFFQDDSKRLNQGK